MAKVRSARRRHATTCGSTEVLVPRLEERCFMCLDDLPSMTQLGSLQWASTCQSNRIQPKFRRRRAVAARDMNAEAHDDLVLHSTRRRNEGPCTTERAFRQPAHAAAAARTGTQSARAPLSGGTSALPRCEPFVGIGEEMPAPHALFCCFDSRTLLRRPLATSRNLPQSLCLFGVDVVNLASHEVIVPAVDVDAVRTTSSGRRQEPRSSAVVEEGHRRHENISPCRLCGARVGGA